MKKAYYNAVDGTRPKEEGGDTPSEVLSSRLATDIDEGAGTRTPHRPQTTD